MTESKLDVDQQIRLEALDQANTSLLDQKPITNSIIRRARVFEAYIRTGEDLS